MLKISQQAQNPEIVRVSLSGHFTSEYVPEVEKALGRDGNKSKTCTVDLLNVTFVDRPAMEFLRIAQSRKIKLENLPSWVKRWIQQEAAMAPTFKGPPKVNSQAAINPSGRIIISRNSPGNYEFFKTQTIKETRTDAERSESERTTNARRLAAFC